MTLNLTIEPAYIPYSGERLGEIMLMKHQQQARLADEKMVVLDAPTSSGKTLAMLTRFMEKDGNGVMLYPTNELIKDQGRSIKDLFDGIGISSMVIPMSADIADVRDDLDVIIAVVTGETLEGLAQTKGEAIQNILRLVDGERRLLVLTNVDTLYLMFGMKYWRGKRLLSEFLSLDFSLLAVDELHLYSGIAFTNLLYLVWLLRDRFEQIIVSSATLSDSTDILKELFEDDYQVIRPKVLSENNSDARQIRHELELKITTSQRILSHDDLDKVLRAIENLYTPPSECEVDTLVIVNSVVFSEQLSEILIEKYGSDNVGVVNGFVPHDLRERKELTVGTSAVEVGVDFDIKNLVFEGTNAGSFIQRLGRCGRHRVGRAVAFIPVGAYRKMEGTLEDERMTMDELSCYIQQSISHLENYSRFSKSIYGASLFLSLLFPFEKKITKLKKSWDNLKPPFFEHTYWDRVKKIINGKVVKIMSKGGARGDILSTPVYIKKYGVYSRMDVLDVPRTSFYFEKVENVDAPVPTWLTEDEVAVVEEYGTKDWIEGNWRGPLLNKSTPKIQYTKTTGEDTTLSLHLGNQRLEELARDLFDEKIAHPTTTSNLTDWRFPRIYNNIYNNQCLVIGLDALVQKYVENIT